VNRPREKPVVGVYELTVDALWTLPWRRVQSSNLALVAQDGDNLFVRFRGGGVYVYEGVGPLIADCMVAMGEIGSPGAFLNERIKPLYDCRRVVQSEEGDERG
jgi:hypothetical protein